MPPDASPDETRVGSALIIAVTGILVPAILAAYLAHANWKATDIGSIIGIFTGLVGTLVGAFLGVQVGSAGKRKADDLANRALGALPAETAADILRSR